jgi:fatty acid desaturase
MALNQQEIMALPEKYRPLGAWTYFLYSILYAIPVVGFICLIVFSLSDANINRRSFSRSYFCIYLILVVLLIMAIALGTFATLITSGNL